MDTLSSLLADFSPRAAAFSTPENWIQLGIILGAILVGLFVSRLLISYLYRHVPSTEATGLRKFALRSIERLLFPVAALLIVLICHPILLSLQLPVKLLDIAITLLQALAGIRVTLYALRKAFTPSPLLKAWESIISSLLWLMVALYLLGWLPTLTAALNDISFAFGGKKITLLNIINFVLFTGLFFTLAMWLSNAIEHRMHRSTNLNASMKVALSKLAKVLVVAFALLIALDTAGIDLTALTVFGGALGVGLGFGLQRIASNFISGFLLLFDKSIKPGDVISINNKFGWVEELRARYIVVRHRDGVDTLIPNENLITSEVINWSYRDKNVRLSVPVSISYDNDPEQAMAILVDAAQDLPRVLPDPAPVARMLEFGDNGINLELRVWINDPEEGLNNIRSDLNLAVWRKFKEKKITIPYPQRDVYIKSSPPQSPAD